MKKIFLLEIFCCIVLLFASAQAERFIEKLFLFNNSTDEIENFNIGLQLKYLSGLGLTGNINVNEQFYMTGSASWLFSIFDLSFGSGFRVFKNLSVFGKLNLISIFQMPSSQILIFPEAGIRVKVFKNINIEIGTIIPFEEENRNALKNYLNVPFIFNTGIVIYIFNK